MKNIIFIILTIFIHLNRVYTHQFTDEKEVNYAEIYKHYHGDV